MEAFAAWAEASSLGLAARGGDRLYPIANIVHLLGLVMLVGSIGIVDLRLAGAFRALPLAALSRALTPLALIGLMLLAASGSILFAADAKSLARSPQFLAKLTLIALALANAMLFRWLWREGAEPDAALRVMAIGSILIWLTVAALGRLIAYT